MANYFKRPLSNLYQTSIIVLMISLTGCTRPSPASLNNICSIFEQYPDWYNAAKQSEQRWGTPIHVQMAIMKQESHFGSTAKSPRNYIFGFIPWGRKSSAYGYAQVLNGTWQYYQENTGNVEGLRSDFADAIDFIGWYTQLAHKQLGISQNNAYDLYLAYHEGLTGYKRQNYLKKTWLLGVASKVLTWSLRYKKQLASCEKNIPNPHFWWRLSRG